MTTTVDELKDDTRNLTTIVDELKEEFSIRLDRVQKILDRRMVLESINLLRVAFQDLNDKYQINADACKILFETNKKSRIEKCHFINRTSDSEELIVVKMLDLKENFFILTPLLHRNSRKRCLLGRL